MLGLRAGMGWWAVSDVLPAICGAIKLVPLGLMKSGVTLPGINKMAMTCVREPGHPERDADSSLHLCGTFAWAIGPGDDYRETDEYRRGRR